MYNVLQNLRYALRQLRRNPGFSAVVIISLALGIGANSTIFSVLNAVIYRPMPYPRPEQLVAIFDFPHDEPDQIEAPPIAEMMDWKNQNQVFQEIGLTSFNQRVSFSGIGTPESIRAQYSTPTFFRVLGVEPKMGRIFRPEEMQDKAQAVLLSDSYWKTKFNSDPQILGRSFNVDGSGSNSGAEVRVNL